MVNSAMPRLDHAWICPSSGQVIKVQPLSPNVASPDETQQAHGVDALQALLLAIEGIHLALSRSGQRLNWITEPGDTGIPRFTPTSFGLVFRQRVERMLDDEIERHAEEGHQRCYEALRRRSEDTQ
jgi:hypothetical protein